MLTEHKLVFQEFVATAAGKSLLSSGAKRLSVSTDSLERLVAQLQPLDFYAPLKAHRRSWKGEQSVRVGFLRHNGGAAMRAYDPDGQPDDVVAGAVQKGGATFVLEAAEPKSRRIHPQASVPGMAIQDENDGEVGGSIVEYRPDGSTKTTDLADYFADKSGPTVSRSLALSDLIARNETFIPFARSVLPCDDCTGGGGTGAPSDTTFLDVFVVIDVCDNLDCWEGNEFEWHTYFSTNNGTTWTNRTDTRLTGIASTSENQFMVPVLFKKIRSSNEKVQTDIVETDGWGDDHFTPSPQWGYGEATKFISAGGSKCGYPRPEGGYFDCYDPYLPFPWREVNLDLTWHPY